MEFVLTHHAAERIEERRIRLEWVERALGEPDLVEEDSSDPTVEHALKRISEREGRVLSHNRVLRPSLERQALKIRYDPEDDAAYVRLSDEEIVDSEEVRPGIVIDYDREHRIVGIEVLSVGRSRPDIDASRVEPEAV